MRGMKAKKSFVVKEFVPDQELEELLNIMDEDQYSPIRFFRVNNSDSTTVVFERFTFGDFGEA